MTPSYGQTSPQAIEIAKKDIEEYAEGLKAQGMDEEKKEKLKEKRKEMVEKCNEVLHFWSAKDGCLSGRRIEAGLAGLHPAGSAGGLGGGGFPGMVVPTARVTGPPGPLA